MPRYFFNVDDGEPLIDEEGTELPDLESARQAAVIMSGEILRDGSSTSLWRGEPWRLWVTEGRRGERLFTLSFFATEGDQSP
jgi:hypothetical protein